MATLLDSNLQVDKAVYSTIDLALKTFSWNILININVFDDSSNSTFIKDKQHDQYFLGLVSQCSLSTTGEKCLNFTLHELALWNRQPTGRVFHIEFDTGFTDKWINNRTISTVKKEEKFIFVFQSDNVFKDSSSAKGVINFAFKSSNEVKLLVKIFDDSVPIDSNEAKQFISLAEANNIKPPRCNMFCVVRYVVKKPSITKVGSSHGIYSVVDPSCPIVTGGVPSGFCVHVFAHSPDFLEKIEIGNVLKLKNVAVQQRLKFEEVEFLFSTFRDNKIVLFSNEMGSLHTPDHHCFNVNEEDYSKAKKLLDWYKEFNPPRKNVVESKNSSPIGAPFSLGNRLNKLESLFPKLLPTEQQRINQTLDMLLANLQKYETSGVNVGVPSNDYALQTPRKKIKLN